MTASALLNDLQLPGQALALSVLSLHRLYQLHSQRPSPHHRGVLGQTLLLLSPLFLVFLSFREGFSPLPLLRTPAVGPGTAFSSLTT